MPSLTSASPISPSGALAGIERDREILEKSFRLPDARRTPLPGPGSWARGLAGLARAGLISVITELSGSGGELRLAQVAGQIPWNVGLRDLQMAEGAFSAWGGQSWRAPASWSAQQRGRAIIESAKLYEELSSRQLTGTQFKQGMDALLQGIMGAVRGPSASESAPRSSSIATARSTAAGAPEVVASRKASQIISGLGRAIREHNRHPSEVTQQALSAKLSAADGQYRQAGHLWSSPIVNRYLDFRAQAEAALARQRPSAQGTKLVAALGEAIRAYDAWGGQGSQRAKLNHALALARSQAAEKGVAWTSATRANFSEFERQAQARLHPVKSGGQPRPARSPEPHASAVRPLDAAVVKPAMPAAGAQANAAVADLGFSFQALSPVQRGSLALLVGSGALGRFVDSLKTAPAATEAEVSARFARHAEASVPSFLREHGAAIGEYMAARGIRDPEAIMAALPGAIETALEKGSSTEAPTFGTLRSIARLMPTDTGFVSSVRDALEGANLPPINPPPPGGGDGACPTPSPADTDKFLQNGQNSSIKLRFSHVGPDARLLSLLDESATIGRIKSALANNRLDLSEQDVLNALDCQSEFGKRRIADFLQKLLDVKDGPLKLEQAFNFSGQQLTLQHSAGQLLARIPPEVRRFLFPIAAIGVGTVVGGNNIWSGIQNIFIRSWESMRGQGSPAGQSLDSLLRSQPGLVASVDLEEAEKLLSEPKNLSPERMSDFLRWIDADSRKGELSLLSRPFDTSSGQQRFTKSEILGNGSPSDGTLTTFTRMHEKAAKDGTWSQLASRYLLSKMDPTLGTAGSIRSARPVTRDMLHDPVALRTELLRRIEAAALTASMSLNYPVAGLNATLAEAHNWANKVKFSGANPGFEDELNYSSRVLNAEVPVALVRAMESAVGLFKIELEQVRSNALNSEPLVPRIGLAASTFINEWNVSIGEARSFSVPGNEDMFKLSVQKLRANAQKLAAGRIERSGDGVIIPLDKRMSPVLDSLNEAASAVSPKARDTALTRADEMLNEVLSLARGSPIFVDSAAAHSADYAAVAARNSQQIVTAREALRAQRENQSQQLLRDAVARWENNRDSWNISQGADRRDLLETGYTTDRFVFPIIKRDMGDTDATAYANRAYSDLVGAGALTEYRIDKSDGTLKAYGPSLSDKNRLIRELTSYFNAHDLQLNPPRPAP